MDITIAQLFETIGRLHTENIFLNKMVLELQNDISILKQPAKEVKKDE